MKKNSSCCLNYYINYVNNNAQTLHCAQKTTQFSAKFVSLLKIFFFAL